MFNPSAPLPPLTTGSRIERSSSKLRKDLLRLVSPQARSNKSACLTPTTSSLSASTTSTARSFLMKSGKMRSLHRKQKSGDSVLTLAKEDAAVVAAPTQQVNHSSQAHPGNRNRNDATYRASDELAAMDRIFEEEDYTSAEARSAKRNSMFVGLPDYRVDSDSNQNFIDPNFLQKAFGITMEENTDRQTFPMLTTIDSNLSSNSNNLAAQDQPTGNTTAKDRRPRIQVSIPDKKTQTLASSRNFDGNTRGTPGTVSPPSTTTTRQRPFNGVATARLSIISPLSVMEMPKPRRPFSAVSLEGMTAHMPESTSAIPNSRSTSSEDSHNEPFEHLSGHSPCSSMSSMVSEPASYKQQESGRNGAPSLAPASKDRHGPSKAPRNIRSLASLQGSTPPRSLKNKSSVISLTGTTVANTNKPLPPEPGQVNVAPLNVVGASPSRSSTITVRQRVATMELGCTASNSSIARRSSKASTLKSKYTPKDLDALDDAFQRNMPLKHQTSRSYASNSTPTLSEVTLALENQLDTIKEDSPPHSIMVPNVYDPLQISRGPMRMEPSRRAPYPPTQTGSPAQEPRRGTGCFNRSGSPTREPRKAPPTSVRNGSPAREPRRAPSPSIRASSPTFDKYETPPRKRVVKKAASSNHVATQLRAADPSHRRSSTAVLISSAKANRILGKDGAITPVRIERKESMESNWTPNESPQVYTTSTSPTEGTHTPESELSVPDAHFEEIRKRLELLSPKDDPSLTFLAFHEMNASRKSVRLPAGQEKIGHIFMKTDLHSTSCPSVEHKIEIPNFIAELEATRNPSPVELEDTQRPLPPAIGSEKIPLVEIVECSNESNVHPLERREQVETLSPPPTPSAAKPHSIHHSRSVKARSLASLAMSEIPELYAELPSPKGVNRPSMTAEEVEQLISADAAERVLLRILQSLETLIDLFAAATVSRGFYRTFKRHELSLVKNALWCMSPAAWELREMSVPSGFIDYSPSLYLQHYIRDIYTMVELKAMMLEHCKSFLRPDTIKGLAGETDRSPFIDDAFWRVWTFCRIFGCGRGREDDIVGQMDWLKGGKLAKQQSTDTNTLAISDGVAMNSVLFNPPRGFSRGNRGGLTAEELYDMSEIWTCLGVLVRGYHGFRREAREFGIFERANIASGDIERENAILEEWTHHLLTLAPATVLDANSPSTPTSNTFAHARSQGYTVWSPPSYGASRSTFLKEAVSRVYHEKMSIRRPTLSTANSFSNLPQTTSSPPPSSSSNGPPDPSIASRQRCAMHAAEIRAKRQDPTYNQLPVSEDRPMSNYPDVLAKLEAQASSTSSAPPVPKLPGLASKILRRQLGSKKDKDRSPSCKKYPFSSKSSKNSSQTSLSSVERHALQPYAHGHIYPHHIPSGPQVRDPVDVAVERLMAMGYEEGRAKKALAEPDSGNSVDFERAVALLKKGEERRMLQGRLDRMG